MTLPKSGRDADTAPPAVQFYWDDFFGDEHVELMSNRQIGAYLRLLRRQWKAGPLPDDIPSLAAIAHETPRVMATLWPGIVTCFVSGPNGLLNGRLERERALQKAYREKKAAAGRIGAARTWQRHPDAVGDDLPLPMAQGSPSVLSPQLPAALEGQPPAMGARGVAQGPPAALNGQDNGNGRARPKEAGTARQARPVALDGQPAGAVLRCPACREPGPVTAVADNEQRTRCPHNTITAGTAVHRCRACRHEWPTGGSYHKACLRCAAALPATAPAWEG